MLRILMPYPQRVKTFLIRLLALAAAVCLMPMASLADDGEPDGWVTFLMICNEGLNNDKGNAGNTMMAISVNTEDGRIRLLEFTWDTFVHYEGYDVPQRLDMPYRNAGAEEAMKVFNDNFGTNVKRFMSLNYLNLASLIDYYGGVTVDITRAERNALNGMVASKKIRLQDEVGTGLLTQAILDALANDYYLNEYGPQTHLNGLQAVGFGWLQYDSVYNCCEREVEVIASLFGSAAGTIAGQIMFYNDESGAPEDTYGRRAINLDRIGDEDRQALRRAINPIFEKVYHNLTDEDMAQITVALAKAAYAAARQGVNIFETVETFVLPLEAKKEYDIIAGAKGHIIDVQANAEAMRDFLYGDR